MSAARVRSYMQAKRFGEIYGDPDTSAVPVQVEEYNKQIAEAS